MNIQILESIIREKIKLKLSEQETNPFQAAIAVVSNIEENEMFSDDIKAAAADLRSKLEINLQKLVGG